MATIKQKKVVEKIVENHGNVSKSMLEAGYSKNSAKNPKNLTNSKGWQALVEKYLPDKLLGQRHSELLNSNRLDHMVFPLGPKDKKNDPNAKLSPEVKTIMEAQQELERTKMTDEDIKKLLNDAGCILRKIVHGNTARHVYFWAPDSQTRDKALEKAYKLKGKYPNEKASAEASEELKEYIEKLNGLLG